MFAHARRSAKLSVMVLEDRCNPTGFYGIWNYFGSVPGDSEDPNNWLSGFGDGDDIYVPANTGPMDLQAAVVDMFTVESGYNKIISLSTNFQTTGDVDFNDVTIDMGGDIAFSGLNAVYTGTDVNFVSDDEPDRNVTFDVDVTFDGLIS